MDTPRYLLDIEDAAKAHELEDLARTAILAAPGGIEALDAASRAHPARRLKSGGVSRRPGACALRDAAKALGHHRALALIRAADERYWSMVLRHDAFICKQASTFAKTTEHTPEWEDLYQHLRVGWYQAAMTFDEARGIRFITMAPRWAHRYIQVVRDQGSLFRVNANGTRFRVPVLRLDAPAPGSDSGAPLSETVADECAYDPEAAQSDAHAAEAAVAAIGELPLNVAHVLRGRFISRRTLADLGVELGVTKERVRQIEAAGVRALQKRFSVP